VEPVTVGGGRATENSRRSGVSIGGGVVGQAENAGEMGGPKGRFGGEDG